MFISDRGRAIETRINDKQGGIPLHHPLLVSPEAQESEVREGSWFCS